MTLAMTAAPTASPQLEVRCPGCRLLLLTYRPLSAPDLFLAIEVRCRRCHRHLDVQLRSGEPLATVRPAQG